MEPECKIWELQEQPIPAVLIGYQLLWQLFKVELINNKIINDTVLTTLTQWNQVTVDIKHVKTLWMVDVNMCSLEYIC